jgi:glycosyltransferase involved in cell wall biosynthesis
MGRSLKMRIFELSAVDITLYKFVLPLMKELKKNNFEVICGARDCGCLEKIRQEGFKTFDIPLCRSLHPIALFKSFLLLIKIFRREKIQILHVHTPIASMVGRLAAFFSGVPIKIYTVHGFILKPRLYYYIEKWMAKLFTDYMFTVNQEDYDLALAHKFMKANRIKNMNSVGIDVRHYDPALITDASGDNLRNNLQIEQGTKIIGFIGRVVKSKGVLDLVQAFINIYPNYNCKLMLIGPWDLDERAEDNIIEELKSLIKANQLEEKVLLLGHREDIAELLGIMDIFVLPSYREGMPVSLLEAMAMEKAVIGTNIRGVREEITPDTGLIYEPNQVKELEEHLKYYLDNQIQADQMGQNARQRVVQYFSQDIVIEKQMKIFMKYSRQMQ